MSKSNDETFANVALATAAATSDAKATKAIAEIKSGILANVAHTDNAAQGTQKSAAGILMLVSGTGWDYVATVGDKAKSVVHRTFMMDTLREIHTYNLTNEKNAALPFAVAALRVAVLDVDPRKPDADGNKSAGPKALEKSNDYVKRSQAFNRALELAAKLAFDGYTHLAYTPNGFKIKRKHVAPIISINKSKHVGQPDVGKPDDTIILDPSKASEFFAEADGEKKRKLVQHSVAAYMRQGKPEGKSKSSEVNVLATINALFGALDEAMLYDDATMTAIGLLSARIVNVTAWNNKSRAEAAKVMKNNETKAA